MKSTEREARRWFEQARDDLRFVEWMHREGIFFDKGCFIAQQSGEKALKACLYARGERRVMGHSLFELLQELARTDNSFEAVLLITRDSDFGALVFLGKAAHNGVILLRIAPETTIEVHQELGVLLNRHREDHLRRCFTTVEPGRHRIRQIPARLDS